MPVWFKNSSEAKKPKIHPDFGKKHAKSHPRQTKMLSGDAVFMDWNAVRYDDA
jgi:hypothetical protein